tara:strand:+ start:1285 stop:1494 length:210 start_codon:yes stop_codon:yes gene_type:complete
MGKVKHTHSDYSAQLVLGLLALLVLLSFISVMVVIEPSVEPVENTEASGTATIQIIEPPVQELEGDVGG